jgi:2-amino-4-hydroxy-6-hydroxymethyldihydropteridine diphosphokinase
MEPDVRSGVPAPAHEVALAVGSNQGDGLGHLRAGVRGLHRAGVWVDIVSSVYRSAAVGDPDQPDFLNAVVVGRWAGSPAALLQVAHRIERAAGRTRPFANAPRTLDIDLIFVGGVVRREAPPILPHPRWRERAFVLAPLAEVAPGWRDPVGGSTVLEVWSSRADELPEARIVAPPSALWSPPT